MYTQRIDSKARHFVVVCVALALGVGLVGCPLGGPSRPERTIMLPGNVPLVLVWIPQGTFMMGRYPGEQDSDTDEDPQHQVTFARGFWMGKYEVTQRQWVAVFGSNPSSYTGDLDRPVESVSFNGALDFITLVSALGQGEVRVPSEAQWEYACRAGTTTRFYWGDDPNYTQIRNYAWYEGNGNTDTHPVGRKRPNAWGLYDMSGNVSEFVLDAYKENYVGAPTDGSALEDDNGYNVIRGGDSLLFAAREECRSADRSGADTVLSYADVGFRVVMEPAL